MFWMTGGLLKSDPTPNKIRMIPPTMPTVSSSPSHLVISATNEIKKEINDSAKETRIDESEVTKDIQKEIEGVKKDIDDFTGPIKRNM